MTQSPLPPPPTDTIPLREAEHNSDWQRAAGDRIIPYSLILGGLIAEAAFIGMVIAMFITEGFKTYFGPILFVFFAGSFVAVPAGLILGIITGPIIYFSLRRKPFAEALLITYTPIFFIAFISVLFTLGPWPVLALIAAPVTLILWPIAVAFIIPDWKPFSLCQSCGYNLDNITTPKCPECGKPNHRHSSLDPRPETRNPSPSPPH